MDQIMVEINREYQGQFKIIIVCQIDSQVSELSLVPTNLVLDIGLDGNIGFIKRSNSENWICISHIGHLFWLMPKDNLLQSCHNEWIHKFLTSKISIEICGCVCIWLSILTRWWNAWELLAPKESKEYPV